MLGVNQMQNRGNAILPTIYLKVKLDSIEKFL